MRSGERQTTFLSFNPLNEFAYYSKLKNMWLGKICIKHLKFASLMLLRVCLHDYPMSMFHLMDKQVAGILAKKRIQNALKRTFSQGRSPEPKDVATGLIGLIQFLIWVKHWRFLIRNMNEINQPKIR